MPWIKNADLKREGGGRKEKVQIGKSSRNHDIDKLREREINKQGEVTTQVEVGFKTGETNSASTEGTSTLPAEKLSAVRYKEDEVLVFHVFDRSRPRLS